MLSTQYLVLPPVTLESAVLQYFNQTHSKCYLNFNQCINFNAMRMLNVLHTDLPVL